MLRVLDLFSGIGGFSLGLEATNGFETIAFCEIDPFCRKVLAKHWPGIPIFEDITKLGEGELNGLGKVDVICGGFPCQPVSCAGKRKGSQDERWLWPQFCRVICEVKPRWVLVENVPGLLSADSGRLFAGILRDLATSGYDAEWNIVSAASVGAPHLRRRVFVVAHPNQIGRHGRAGVFWQGRRAELEDGGEESADSSREGLSQPEQEREYGGSIAERGGWISECRLGGVADGLSSGIHSDRRISNEVHTCTYDVKKTHSRKALLELQSENGKEANGQPLGINKRVQEKEVLLFPMLRELDDCTSGNHHKTCCSKESTKGDQSEPMPELWENGSEIKPTSQRPSKSIGSSSALLKVPCARRSEARELSDQAKTDLCDLRECVSSEGFPSPQNMLGSLFVGIGAQKCHEEMASLNFWAEDWERGIPRTATGQKDRVNRLRALGNAIVPQCATCIAECVLAHEEMSQCP